MDATTNLLVCPACGREHRTLATLLVCHPVELRRLTDGMFAARESWAMTMRPLMGQSLPARFQRVLRGELRYERDGAHGPIRPVEVQRV